MKVLVVGFYTKTYMPYIYKYEDLLKQNHIEYDVVCFDRNTTMKSEKVGNVFLYGRKLGVNRREKIIPYIDYSRFVKLIIKSHHYDKIIVLTTIPAVLLFRVLTKKYKNNYIFDFRDFTFEYLNWYKNAVDKIIDRSFHTFISSKGFLHFLKDSKKISLIHNISNENREKETSAITDNPIKIGFVGYVRYYDVNIALIQALKNESDMSLEYYGTIYVDCDLPGYVEKNHINNVHFYGDFDNQDKPDLYEGITLINSIYSLDSKEVEFAIPNRLYDAALYKRPIIVAAGTYLAEVVEKYELGLIVDVKKDDLKGVIRSYIACFDQTRFLEHCEMFLTDVRKDDIEFCEMLERFLREQ